MIKLLKNTKFLLVILGFFLFSSLIGKNKDNSLTGKWQYLDCTIKNTSVSGTIQFFKDSSFLFNGEVHQDFPTKPFKCRYNYSVIGNKLICLNTSFPPFENPPISEYFFIQGDMLYFSSLPMEKVMDDWSGNYRKTNWTYRLKRVK